jgi:hypothetical protein
MVSVKMVSGQMVSVKMVSGQNDVPKRTTCI